MLGILLGALIGGMFGAITYIHAWRLWFRHRDKEAEAQRDVWYWIKQLIDFNQERGGSDDMLMKDINIFYRVFKEREEAEG